MPWRKLVLTACLGLAGATACDAVAIPGRDAPPKAAAPAESPSSPVLAQLGSEVLTLEAFRERWMRPGAPGRMLEQADPDERADVAERYLERLLDEQLLLSEAKRRGLWPSKEMVAQEMGRLVAEHGARDLHEQVLEAGETPAQTAMRAAERLAKEALLSAIAVEAGAVTTQEIEAHYKANVARYTRPEEVHALQIVVDTEEEAQMVLEALKKGGSFRELARRHSITPEAARGGDLGFFPRGVMPDVFDRACFSLKPGKHTGVVASDYGYHIFKLLELRPAGVLPLIEARTRIRDELARNRAANAEAKLLEGLRAQTPLIVHRDVLARLWSRG